MATVREFNKTANDGSRQLINALGRCVREISRIELVRKTCAMACKQM